jgi:putative ABC transport system permease protein
MDEARRQGLDAARSTGVLSMVFHDERSQLTNLRAVTSGYPLRGQVRSAAEAFATGVATREVPGRGEVWWR